MSDISVLLSDVTFSYDREKVLKDLSLEIKNHRICFIMGNNGSGKTTLLKNIMGVLSPQTGKIMIEDRDVSSLDHLSMSKLVSYVPQAIHLNTDFKVVDYLSLGRTPHTGLLNQLSDSDYEIIDKYVSKFGLNECLDIEFNKLSGGQKQMVSIVRSLIQDTPIIVLDEPMSALDIGKQVDLLKAFRELSADKTIILTSHNPNHALAVACDVCFMRQGTVFAYGNCKEVINERNLYEIYGENIALDHGKFDSVVFDAR